MGKLSLDALSTWGPLLCGFLSSISTSITFSEHGLVFVNGPLGKKWFGKIKPSFDWLIAHFCWPCSPCERFWIYLPFFVEPCSRCQISCTSWSTRLECVEVPSQDIKWDIINMQTWYSTIKNKVWFFLLATTFDLHQYWKEIDFVQPCRPSHCCPPPDSQIWPPLPAGRWRSRWSGTVCEPGS